MKSVVLYFGILVTALADKPISRAQYRIPSQNDINLDPFHSIARHPKSYQSLERRTQVTVDRFERVLPPKPDQQIAGKPKELGRRSVVSQNDIHESLSRRSPMQDSERPTSPTVREMVATIEQKTKEAADARRAIEAQRARTPSRGTTPARSRPNFQVAEAGPSSSGSVPGSLPRAQSSPPKLSSPRTSPPRQPPSNTLPSVPSSPRTSPPRQPPSNAIPSVPSSPRTSPPRQPPSNAIPSIPSSPRTSPPRQASSSRIPSGTMTLVVPQAELSSPEISTPRISPPRDRAPGSSSSRISPPRDRPPGPSSPRISSFVTAPPTTVPPRSGSGDAPALERTPSTGSISSYKSTLSVSSSRVGELLAQAQVQAQAQPEQQPTVQQQPSPQQIQPEAVRRPSMTRSFSLPLIPHLRSGQRLPGELTASQPPSPRMSEAERALTLTIPPSPMQPQRQGQSPPPSPSQSQPQPLLQAQPQTQTQPQPQLQASSQVHTRTRTQPQAQVHSQTQTQPQTEAQSRERPREQPRERTQPQTQTQTQVQPQSQAQNARRVNIADSPSELTASSSRQPATGSMPRRSALKGSNQNLAGMITRPVTSAGPENSPPGSATAPTNRVLQGTQSDPPVRTSQSARNSLEGSGRQNAHSAPADDRSQQRPPPSLASTQADTLGSTTGRSLGRTSVAGAENPNPSVRNGQGRRAPMTTSLSRGLGDVAIENERHPGKLWATGFGTILSGGIVGGIYTGINYHSRYSIAGGSLAGSCVGATAVVGLCLYWKNARTTVEREQIPPDVRQNRGRDAAVSMVPRFARNSYNYWTNRRGRLQGQGSTDSQGQNNPNPNNENNPELTTTQNGPITGTPVRPDPNHLHPDPNHPEHLVRRNLVNISQKF